MGVIVVYSMTLDLLCVTRQGIEKHNNLQIQRMWFKQFYAKGHSLIFEAPRLETFVNQCWLLDRDGCRSSSGFHCDKGGSCCLSFPLEPTAKYAHVIFTSLSGLDTDISSCRSTSSAA